MSSFNVITDGSVGWGVDRVFGSVVCRSSDGEVNIPNMDLM